MGKSAVPHTLTPNKAPDLRAVVLASLETLAEKKRAEGQPFATSLVTISGVMFDPMHATAKDVRIYDIAYALARIPRYNGHTTSFYSVAEHSILVAKAVFRETGNEDLRNAALLHDASEAYLGDVCSGVKSYIRPIYEILETRVMETIADHFDIRPNLFDHPVLTETDKRMVWNEREKLLNQTDSDWWKIDHGLNAPLHNQLLSGVVIRPMDSLTAFHTFISYFLDCFYPHLRAMPGDSDGQKQRKMNAGLDVIYKYEA